MKDQDQYLLDQHKIKVFNSVSELSEVQQQLVKTAMEHTSFSYSPYSHFAVGASILLENGIILGGSNQENASYPLCLCAERTALAAAASIHPNTAVHAIAVTAFMEGEFIETPASPCGACRQVISEYAYRFKQDVEVILHSRSQIVIFKTIDDLLPLGFNFDSLPKKK